MTSLSLEEERTLIKGILKQACTISKSKKYGFHFILSYDCNLRCVYCYEDSILNGGNCISKKKMSKEQVDKAFEIIDKYGNKKNKKISLYGGEPFLESNYEIITYIVTKGKELNYHFSVTSNGYDIDKYLPFIKENKIFSFQITLDGIAHIHNARKPHYKNNDSFEKITNNIDSLLKLSIPVKIRINTDSYTIEQLHKLILFFKEHEWFQYKHFSAYCALLRKEIPLKGESLFQDELKLTQSLLIQRFDKEKFSTISNGKIQCQDYKVYNTIIKLLQGKKLPYKTYFCGAQNAMLIFDPIGDLYSCWDVVGIREERVGEYIPEFRIDPQLSKKWFNNPIYKSKCTHCQYVLFCGGGCPAFNYRSKGKVESGACNDYPQLFKYTIQKIYAEKLKQNFTNE